MKAKKYKLTEETINVNDRTLYRIESLKDFSNVKKGDKGGFVEKESNLSHYGNCWVYEDARVYGNAIIFGNAKVFDNAMVYDHAKIYDNAMVYNNAKVYGNAIICDNARVYNNAEIYGNAEVYGYTMVKNNVKVYGDALICGDTLVYDNARICGNAVVYGKARICRDAIITSNSDYIVFKNWWSSGRYFTWTKSNNMWKVGCFYGTGEQLIEKAYEDSEKSGREYERVVRYDESIIKDYHK